MGVCCLQIIEQIRAKLCALEREQIFFEIHKMELSKEETSVRSRRQQELHAELYGLILEKDLVLKESVSLQKVVALQPNMLYKIKALKSIRSTKAV